MADLSSYTVAPHLGYFKIPIKEFAAARPEFDSYATGAYIFFYDASNTGSAPRLLLLQRALTDSMPGMWEGPGGACEPDEDKTILDGVAREVLEESGLHVSRFVELVSAVGWTHKRRRDGVTIRIAKYSFIVEVHESVCHDESTGTSLVVPCDEIPVRLEASEHQAFGWAVEEEVRASMQPNSGICSFPTADQQGASILTAFELFGSR
ncbi:hypothetical protein N7488_004211 [Penicillium malachiteum]|nr:hypothetical protein N7488_004211 [Penicillium malachiteum]